ncbi:GtrA family protein [Phascolarctobacterium sp.]|uniref:GtrA family protein n=1 Tax=Phascolarctobacterium sp. TaxID=2049039 RepID=UPI0034C6458F
MQKLFFEVIRFGLVGCLSFVVDYGLLYFYTEFLGVRYLYSAAISFSISLLLNYWLCVRYVFQKAVESTAKRQLLFIVSSIAGLGLNQFCMYVLVEICLLYYMKAKIISTVVVMFWNYIMKRKAVKG